MAATRIMYIENKSGQLSGSKGVQGPAVIGRVTFSQTLRTLYYGGRELQKIHFSTGFPGDRPKVQ